MFIFILILLFTKIILIVSNYEPNWDSLDSRPLPNWYDEMKLGIFVHWGVYSVPAFHSEWFWYYWKKENNSIINNFVLTHYNNKTTYADFAKEFTAEDFDAKKFVEQVKNAGAKYLVLTTKHHEGYTLWPSSTSWNWNSIDVGPHRNLVAEFAENVRKANLHFGVYFSLMDWFHPLFLSDLKTNNNQFATTITSPQLHELVDNFKPDIIWSDGDWDKSDEYWKSKEFLTWLYNKSPIKKKVVVNDRWGSNVLGKHGGFLTHSDEFDPGVLMSRKWENCLKLDQKSWGYRRDIQAIDVLSIKTIILKLARTISCGGNLLLNLGPDRLGRIIPIFQERLNQLGEFVNKNDEAIFGSKPWIYQNESNNVWYTSQLRNKQLNKQFYLYNKQDAENTIVYAFVVDIPTNLILHLTSVNITSQTKVKLLESKFCMQIQNQSNPYLILDLKQIPWQKWPSFDVLVFKIEYAASSTKKPKLKNFELQNETIIKTK